MNYMVADAVTFFLSITTPRKQTQTHKKQ